VFVILPVIAYITETILQFALAVGMFLLRIVLAMFGLNWIFP
jgi:hypothetical protein